MHTATLTVAAKPLLSGWLILHRGPRAQRAASLADTHAHIQTATHHLSHPLWQQSRTWDPDD